MRVATAFMAALVREKGPCTFRFIMEILLGLFLGDFGAADGVSEVWHAFVGNFGDVDDVNKIAAESVVVDYVLDLQGKPQEGR